MQEPVPGIHAEPDEQNARYFHVVVAGPEEVSYYGRSTMTAPTILIQRQQLLVKQSD